MADATLIQTKKKRIKKHRVKNTGRCEECLNTVHCTMDLGACALFF